jgi:hypothetical protein
MSACACTFEGFATACDLELEAFQKKIARAIQGPERECIVLIHATTARAGSRPPWRFTGS